MSYLNANQNAAFIQTFQCCLLIGLRFQRPRGNIELRRATCATEDTLTKFFVHPWTHQECGHGSHRACASMDTQEMRLWNSSDLCAHRRTRYAAMEVIGPVRPWTHRKCVYGNHRACAPIDAQGMCLWKSSGLCAHRCTRYASKDPHA